MYTFKRNSKDGKSKEILLSNQVTSILKFDIPPKFKDHGVPTISCYISNHTIENSSVDLIPDYVCLKLGLGELIPFACTLRLVDGLVRTPTRQIDKVLVQIDKGIFLVEFVMLGMDPSHASKQSPFILEHPPNLCLKMIVNASLLM